MSDTTPLFGLTYPTAGDTAYMADLVAFFTELEVVLGQNTNLILEADTVNGTGGSNDLGFIASGTVVEKADATASRWGRVVLQAPMVDTEDMVTRLLGIAAPTGAGGSMGTAIYHSSSADEVVTSPASAVIADSGRILFLPLGMCLGSGSALFNGAMPLGVCPVVGSGEMYEYADGSNNPVSSGIVSGFSGSPPAWHYEAQFDGAAQDIDAVFPILVPADFHSFPNKAGASFWGIRTQFKRQDISTTGYAGGQIVGFVDTAGVEHTALGTAVELANAWTDQTVTWATLAGLAPTMTPGRTCFVRLKLRGNNGDFVDFMPPMLQYFPNNQWN